jgi:hypothetical protein
MFGEKASCFSVKVSMNTTDGAVLSKILIRRDSDSSKITVAAFEGVGAPINADVRTAADPKIRFLRLSSSTV